MENKTKDLLITHLFNAPVKQVFAAWTTKEHLENWYAPEGCTIVFKSLDVKTGGAFHSCIHDPVHGDCWIKGSYSEVSDSRLVFSMILSNELGDTTTAVEAGKAETWPQAIITTVTFTPIGSQTKVTLHQTVAEEEAKKTGAYQSWFSMFDKLNSQLVFSDY
jgi:uncharacterized protein YndB with AHSA1/START domain